MAILLAACGGKEIKKERGAIVMGDSATIVTETDSQYLRNDVTDIYPDNKKWKEESAGPSATEAGAAVEKTADKEEQKPEARPAVAGQVIDLGNGITLQLTGMELKDARKQDPGKDNGLTYVVRSGDVLKAHWQVTGAKSVDIKQRYQSSLSIKTSLGSLDLRNMGLYTSGWTPLKRLGAPKDQWELAGLDKPAFSPINNQKIKNAADKALRNNKSSQKTIQNWMKELRNVNDIRAKECDVVLDNVQWRIDLVDAKGQKSFKNVRLDL